MTNILKKSGLLNPIKQHTIPVFLLYEWSRKSIKGIQRYKGDSDFLINVLDIATLNVDLIKGKDLYTKDQYTIDGTDYSLEKGFAKLEGDLAELVKGINYTTEPGEFIKNDLYRDNVIKLMKYYLIKSSASQGSKTIAEWYRGLPKGGTSSEINDRTKELLEADAFSFFENRVDKVILMENHSQYSFPAISNIGIMLGVDIVIPVWPFRAVKFVMYKNTDKFIIIPKFSRYTLKRNKDITPMFDKFYLASGGKIVIGNEPKPYFLSCGFRSRLVKFINKPLPNREDVIPFGETEASVVMGNMIDEIDFLIEHIETHNVKPVDLRTEINNKYKSLGDKQ